MRKYVAPCFFIIAGFACSQLVLAQSPGDVIITEIMQNPSAVSDANGEWFEIYNTTGSAINIDGWTIRDDGSDSHTINNGGPLTVPANGFLVLCRNANTSVNGNVPCDYDYSSFTLGNMDDEVILQRPGPVVIDRVDYDGGPSFPDPDGASMYLKNFTLDNNVGSNWETSTTAWSGSDLGSPGSAGDAVIPVELSSFTASVENSEIRLTWITQTETENLGFHLFRSLLEQNDYIKITQEIVRGAGTSAQPHSYSYIDRAVEPDNTYFYKLADVDFNGTMEFHGPVSATLGSLPTEYDLAQNYPNPFNPNTSIGFALPEAGLATLTIYNLIGQRVRTLISKSLEPGEHSVQWDGMDEQGEPLASGVYLYRLQAGEFSAVKKLTLMK